MANCMESRSKTLSHGVVAEVLVVAGEAEHVIDPEGGGPQDVALMAMRFRSRVVICTIGSSPMSLMRMQQAREHIRHTEVWLSVTLMAST